MPSEFVLPLDCVYPLALEGALGWTAVWKTSALAFLLALGLTFVLARGARALGLQDESRGGVAARKPQRTGVPYVGGAVLLAVLALGWCMLGTARLLDPSGFLHLAQASALERGCLWASLFLAFLVGLWDDGMPDGLAPVPKVAAQFLAAGPLGYFCAKRFGPELSEMASLSPLGGILLATALSLVLAVAAMNVANTFDNHDGALTAVGLVGFSWAATPIAAGLAGFLPWNLNAMSKSGKAWEDPGATPTAYAGDSGSHLLGLVALINVWAWPVLLVPCLDLARLSVVRWRAGSAPWVGDRRHLAHLLGARNLSRPCVAGLLGLATIPASLGVWLGRTEGGFRSPGMGWIEIGCAVSSILVCALLWGGRTRPTP